MRATNNPLPKLAGRACGLALGLAALAAPSVADAGVKWGGDRSGLAWSSGANGDHDGIERLRGRKLDFRTMFVSLQNWNHMVRDAGYARSLARRGSDVVVAMGMLPKSNRAQHSQCARGQFDNHMRAFGRALVNAGESTAVLRLGWEANRAGGFAWAVTGDGSSYKACFRRWVSVLRSVPGQRFTIDWNMGQRGTWSRPLAQMYPGNDVVDVIGVQNYDRCAPVRTAAEWNRKINHTSRTGTLGGINNWLRFAKSKGKRLSMPEWGIGGPRNVCKKPGFDNPFFMQQMHRWFRDNARSIAYEAYFNGDGGPARGGSHKLTNGRNPRAAGVYRSLW